MIRPAIEELEYPDLERDMKIIARERFRMDKAEGHVGKDEREAAAIPPFRCPIRGYLCTEDELLMLFFPDVVDVDMCVDAIRDVEDDVVECWILEDDQVVDYREYPDEPDAPESE